jgi:hypothetical protein
MRPLSVAVEADSLEAARMNLERLVNATSTRLHFPRRLKQALVRALAVAVRAYDIAFGDLFEDIRACHARHGV